MAKFTDRQRTDLNNYLTEKYDLIRATNPNTSEVAAWCREVLKFEVDTTNITSRLGPNGTLFTHIWPGTETSKKGRLTDRLKNNLVIEQIELIRADIARLASACGEASYGRRIGEWDEILAGARSDVADTDRREPEER